MRLDLYHIFLKVARHKSVSLAAKELYITQPAVSQAIKQLEQQLDSQLFVRTTKGVTLTESGEMLFEYVENALNIISAGEHMFEKLRSLEGGTLRIGASDTLCRYMLLPHLSRFHDKYPDVRISVTNRTSGETIKLLSSGDVDIGFINLPTEINDDMAVEELAQVEETFVYGEKYYSEFNSKTVKLNDLTDYLVIMLERQSSSRQYVDAYLSGKNITINPQIELGSLDLLIEFAKSGMGIALVPAEYAKEHIENGTLYKLDTTPKIPKRSIGLIYKKKIPLSIAAKTFLSEMKGNENDND